MTKRHQRQCPGDPTMLEPEPWLDAVARAVAETLGVTLTRQPERIVDVPSYRQSQRDGQVRRYSFQAYRLEVDAATRPAPGVLAEWLSAEELLDPERRPVSPTARFLIEQGQGQARLRGEQFPV